MAGNHLLLLTTTIVALMGLLAVVVTNEAGDAVDIEAKYRLLVLFFATKMIMHQQFPNRSVLVSNRELYF
jgi:hypothetical protein